jgi:hypothetical protein
MISMLDGTRPASSRFSIVDASFNIRKGSLSYYQFALLTEFILVAAMNRCPCGKDDPTDGTRS